MRTQNTVGPIKAMFISEFQTKEEQLFGNRGHSDRMEEFLSMIGDKVSLKDFQGWVNG